MEKENAVITMGGGCFWCLDAAMRKIPGVKDVVSGYAGGETKEPTYRQVCSGNTGHAEVVQVHYNPEKVSLSQILDFFWILHDPTTLNQQGNDIGTQYRSIILYQTAQEKEVIQQSVEEAQQNFSAPIVTQIRPLDVFYPAENYHQDYYRKNPYQPYCAVVISPKLIKLSEKLDRNKRF